MQVHVFSSKMEMAQAVYDCFTGEVTPFHPASILRQHAHTDIFLDAKTASLLQQQDALNSSGEREVPSLGEMIPCLSDTHCYLC